MADRATPETCEVCGRPKASTEWHAKGECSGPLDPDCQALGYARERTARQASEAALSRLLERPSAQALAAAQARATAAEAKLRTAEEALERCSDLFADIRSDWSDPRTECRAGAATIAAALAALRSQVAPAAGAGAQWTAGAGDPCMVEGCTEKIAVACLPSEFKACERHFADHERDCRHCGPAQREEE